MKKALLILFLMPFFAHAQIVYPQGRSVDDSTTFTFTGSDSLVHSFPGSFGGATITIDTASDSLWQIGSTVKPVFITGSTAVTGIMTDTAHFYPAHANAFFTLKMEPAVSNFIVDLWHKYETDSFHAGCIVEFSVDSGSSWMNIANCSTINAENFYTQTDTIASGEPAFTGSSSGEQLSRFQFINCFGLKSTTTNCSSVWQSLDNPIYFRFRFVSDSTVDTLSGWIIDSIRIENPGCFPGLVAEINNPAVISIFPNPAYDELTITASDKIRQIEIFNVLGQTIFARQYNTEQVNADVSGLPVGVYFIKINGTDVRKL